MTTLLEKVATEPLAVMRKAELDPKDAAIIIAIASRWADGKSVTYRDIYFETGISITSSSYRITGQISTGVDSTPALRTGGGLVERGWVADGAGEVRGVLRPGPRFAGMQRRSGVVYEWAND